MFSERLQQLETVAASTGNGDGGNGDIGVYVESGGEGEQLQQVVNYDYEEILDVDCGNTNIGN